MVHFVMFADEKAPKSYYAVIFAGQKNDYSSLLVAPIIEGEESYWNIVQKKVIVLIIFMKLTISETF